MKKYTALLSQLVTSFFLMFGLLEFLFFIGGLLPHSGGLVGVSLFETVLCIGAALVLSISHAIISSEFLDRFVSIKLRVIICGISCVIMLGILTVYYGIPSLIVLLLGLKSELAASAIWIIAFTFCLSIVVLLYYLIERNFRNIGKKYDAALAAYKRK